MLNDVAGVCHHWNKPQQTLLPLILPLCAGAEGPAAIFRMRVDVFGFLCSLLSGSCRHRRYTFPMSSRRESSAASAGTRAPAYVVCLDCAKRFPYDWEQMRVIWTPEPSAIPTGANAEPLGSGMPAFPADGVRETVALASPSTTLSSKVSSWIWMLRRQRLPARLRSLLRTSLRWRVSH